MRIGLLLALMMIVLSAVGVVSYQLIKPRPPLPTPTPSFLDPRLALEEAYPFRGRDNQYNPTALPLFTLPDVIEREFNLTGGVHTCQVDDQYQDAMGYVSLTAICQVEVGLNRLEMAELLRRLADRQYWEIPLKLTLDDGQTRTTYQWTPHEWQIVGE